MADARQEQVAVTLLIRMFSTMNSRLHVMSSNIDMLNVRLKQMGELAGRVTASFMVMVGLPRAFRSDFTHYMARETYGTRGGAGGFRSGGGVRSWLDVVRKHSYDAHAERMKTLLGRTTLGSLSVSRDPNAVPATFSKMMDLPLSAAEKAEEQKILDTPRNRQLAFLLEQWKKISARVERPKKLLQEEFYDVQADAIGLLREQKLKPEYYVKEIETQAKLRAFAGTHRENLIKKMRGDETVLFTGFPFNPDKFDKAIDLFNKSVYKAIAVVGKFSFSMFGAVRAIGKRWYGHGKELGTELVFAGLGGIEEFRRRASGLWNHARGHLSGTGEIFSGVARAGLGLPDAIISQVDNQFQPGSLFRTKVGEFQAKAGKLGLMGFHWSGTQFARLLARYPFLTNNRMLSGLRKIGGTPGFGVATDLAMMGLRLPGALGSEGLRFLRNSPSVRTAAELAGMGLLLPGALYTKGRDTYLPHLRARYLKARYVSRNIRFTHANVARSRDPMNQSPRENLLWEQEKKRYGAKDKMLEAPGGYVRGIGLFPRRTRLSKYANIFWKRAVRSYYGPHPYLDKAQWFGNQAAKAALPFLAGSALATSTLGTGAPDTMATLMGSFKLLAATIGQSLIKPALEFSAKLQAWAAWFHELAPATKDTIGWMTKWGLTLSGGLIVISKIITVITPITKALQVMALGLHTTTGKLAAWGAALGTGVLIGNSIGKKAWETQDEVLAKVKEMFEQSNTPYPGFDPTQHVPGYADAKDNAERHRILTDYASRLRQEDEGYDRPIDAMMNEGRRSLNASLREGILKHSDEASPLRKLVAYGTQSNIVGYMAMKSAGVPSFLADLFKPDDVMIYALAHGKTMSEAGGDLADRKKEGRQKFLAAMNFARDFEPDAIDQLKKERDRTWLDYHEKREALRGMAGGKEQDEILLQSAREKDTLLERKIQSIKDMREKMPAFNAANERQEAANKMSSILPMFVSKAQPQFGTIEDAYKQIQIRALDKGPLELALERIQRESFDKMLEELSKSSQSGQELVNIFNRQYGGAISTVKGPGG